MLGELSLGELPPRAEPSHTRDDIVWINVVPGVLVPLDPEGEKKCARQRRSAGVSLNEGNFGLTAPMNSTSSSFAALTKISFEYGNLSEVKYL